MANIIKKQLVKIAKQYPATRLARHHYVVRRNSLLRRLYSFYRIDPKVIIFEAYNGRSYACSPKAIYEEMLHDERFKDYSFVWVFRSPSKYQFLLENPRTSLVKYRSPKYYRTYATSKYWITNSMLPMQVMKRPEQVLLQCWHGTPLKRLRNDIIENTKNATNNYADFVRKNAIDTNRYDYLISPSRAATEKFTSAFGLKQLGKENIIIETGYPRNDFLYRFTEDNVEQIKERLNIPRDKKVLLYAPTWRDDQHDAGKGFVYESPVDFDYLQEELGDDYVILFRAHYYIADSFDFSAYQGFLYDVPKVDDVNELYIISDALITDYSSVLFDYANLRRPILFYMYDLEHYQTQLRGFYFDVSELPGDIITKEAEVVSTLKSLQSYQLKHANAYKKFNEKFNYLDDGNAASRAIDAVFFGQARGFRPGRQSRSDNKLSTKATT